MIQIQTKLFSDYNLGTDKTYFIKTNVVNYLKNNESESINKYIL